MSKPFQENVLPDPIQALLLKACLHEDLERAESALSSWCENLDLNDIDFGSFRLVPLLWKRASEQNWNLGEDEGRLRGVYRYHWSKQQMLMQGARIALSRLQDEGIKVTLLKGIAISQSFYEDPVTRPFSDIDILVPGPEVQDAIRVLENEKWKTQQSGIDNALQHLHGVGFRQDSGIELDLHWHILQSNATDQVTSILTEPAASIELFDRTFATLRPEHHLIHTCDHGAVFSPWPHTRWLADAHRIVMMTPEGLDWDLVFHIAKDTGTILPVVHTLAWLEENLATPIPAELIERLSGERVSTVDRMLFRASALKTPENPKFRHRLPTDLSHFLRKKQFRCSPQWFQELRGYLYASNNFNQSFRGVFRNWSNIALIKLRNIQYGYLPFWLSGTRNWRLNRESISRRKESELFGFYLLECDYQKRLLRWSAAEACLNLGKLDYDSVLEIETARCRKDLLNPTEIQFLLNEQPLPDNAVSIDASGIISVKLTSPIRTKEFDSWVKWKVDPWNETSEDPRELGIPIYAYRITRLKTERDCRKTSSE